MTGAEAIHRLEDLGARFELAPDGSIRADLPDPGPAAMPLFLAELQAHRADAVDALRRRAGAPVPACYVCGTPVAGAQNLLCQPCYLARRGPGRVLPFDPARRARTEARLSGARCQSCGGSWYRVHPNGDSECEPCRRARAAAPGGAR